MIKWLDGKKTYIGVLAAFVYIAGITNGYWMANESVAEVIGLLGGIGIVHKMDKAITAIRALIK